MFAALLLCLLHARHYEVCRKPKFLMPGLRNEARAARSLRPRRAATPHSYIYDSELVTAVTLIIFSLCPPQAPGRSPSCRWLRLCCYASVLTLCFAALLLCFLFCFRTLSVESHAPVEYLPGTQPKGQKQLSHKCVRRMSKHIYGIAVLIRLVVPQKYQNGVRAPSPGRAAGGSASKP